MKVKRHWSVYALIAAMAVLILGSFAMEAKAQSTRNVTQLHICNAEYVEQIVEAFEEGGEDGYNQKFLEISNNNPQPSCGQYTGPMMVVAVAKEPVVSNDGTQSLTLVMIMVPAEGEPAEGFGFVIKDVTCEDCLAL